MNLRSISRRDRVRGVPLTSATMLQEKRACFFFFLVVVVEVFELSIFFSLSLSLSTRKKKKELLAEGGGEKKPSGALRSSSFCRWSLLLFVFSLFFHLRLAERLERVLVQVGHGDTRGELCRVGQYERERERERGGARVSEREGGAKRETATAHAR